MKLDYTKDFTQDQIEYLKTLSKNELEVLLKQCNSSAIISNTNQLNRKILINALYGALGNIHFRYYDIRNAAAITTFGQLTIQWAARYINEYMNRVCKTKDVEYVFYIDTDSNYIELTHLVEEVIGTSKFRDTDHLIDFLDKFGSEKLEPMLKDCHEDLAKYMNSYKNKLSMDREAIFCPDLGSDGVGAFWKAKKRYALNVRDMEGTRYKVPKMKIMGIETQQSSTPKAVQVALKESIRRILQEGEESLQQYYSEFEKQYYGMDYKELASISTANNIQKYNDNGYPASKCPKHIRGVLTYKRAIQGTYAPDIQEGEKVMVLPLKDANPYKDTVISWTSGNNLPNDIKEEVLRHVDLQYQFAKTFKSPLESICECSGLDFEKKSSLSDLFDF